MLVVSLASCVTPPDVTVFPDNRGGHREGETGITYYAMFTSRDYLKQFDPDVRRALGQLAEKEARRRDICQSGVDIVGFNFAESGGGVYARFACKRPSGT